MKVHAEFQSQFIVWALRFAIFAGFALGAHVISVIAFNFPLGKAFYSYIQTHGHIQLVGWAGLFIMGVSLHFIPRLAGVPLEKTVSVQFALSALVSGLLLRFVAHSVLPYIVGTAFFMPASYLVLFSGIAIWLGCLTYLSIIFTTMRRVPAGAMRPALTSVKPFFLLMLAGWLIYPTANVVLLGYMTGTQSITAHQGWNESAVQCFINFTMLPVAFAFSVRLFPLYLRLPAIDWPVHRFGWLFLVTVGIYTMVTLPPVLALEWPGYMRIAALSMLSKSGIIIAFVIKLDILTRMRPPWTVHRVLHPGPERRPTREGLPDYGEFGTFEKLVYAAFGWLFFAAILEAASAISLLINFDLPISTDAIRHAYLLGFITQLILGVSVRMIPGFLHKKAIAKPHLVIATFWLINLATVGRIFPLLMPADWLAYSPVTMIVFQTALGLSGVVAMLAILLLYFNLLATIRSPRT